MFVFLINESYFICFLRVYLNTVLMVRAKYLSNEDINRRRVITIKDQ